LLGMQPKRADHGDTHGEDDTLFGKIKGDDR